MNDKRSEPIGGGTNARPLRDTVAQTGPGLPDDALAPDEASPAERTGEGDSERRRAMAEKLKSEAKS